MFVNSFFSYTYTVGFNLVGVLYMADFSKISLFTVVVITDNLWVTGLRGLGLVLTGLGF